jgi:glucokinase
MFTKTSAPDVLLGIDIGGSYVRCVAYESTCNRFSDLNKMAFKKSTTALEEVEENICFVIRDTLSRNHYSPDNLQGIGISLAALFDRPSGRIVSWPNNKSWSGFPLRQYLTSEFNVPITMEDDANSFALAQYCNSQSTYKTNMAYITISTGIGCGLIFGGKLYTGENGWAGELGHTRIPFSNTPCVCGKTGCLQSMASGPALFKQALKINAAQSKPFSLTDMETVTGLLLKGADCFQQVFDEAGQAIAYAIEYLIMLLDVEQIVLGGGVMHAGDLLLNPVKNSLEKLLADGKRDVCIEKSALGEEGGAMGAIYLIKD